jgi:nitrogen permease regulator 3
MLGICLVVHGDRGHQLVFRHPPISPADDVDGYSTNWSDESALKRAVQAASRVATSSTSSSTTTTTTTTTAAAAASASSTTSTTATTDSTNVRQPIRQPYDIRNLEVDTNNNNSNNSKSSASGVAAATRTSGQRQQLLDSGQLPYGIPQKQFARLFCPGATLCGHVLEIVIDRLRFIGHPVRLPVDTNHETTMFNVLFVVRADTDKHQLKMYRHGAIALARAIEYEQNRCGFLSDQVQIMLSIRDECSAQNQADSKVDAPTMSSMMFSHSVLAGQLQQLCVSLLASSSAHMVMNGYVDLHFSLADPAVHPDFPIRPYHTLLLIQSPPRIMDELPPDASPALRRLIANASPLKSFQELESMVGVSIHQLFRLAAHLVHWKKGRIINTLTKHNVYVVSSKANLQLPKEEQIEFKRAFPGQTVSFAMSNFSVQKKLSEHLLRYSQTAQLQAINELIWLFQRELVVQLHTYVYFIPTAEECTVAPRSPSQPLTAEEKSMLPPILRKPALALASDLERDQQAYFLDPQNQGSHMPLLKRLYRYFQGKYHLEEIMWRENITRSELNALLQVLGHVLIETSHE